MTQIKRKLSSRKLWAALAGLAMGLALAFGADGNTITQVTGAVTSLASLAAYILAEGKVDAARVSQAAVDVETILRALGQEQGE